MYIRGNRYYKHSKISEYWFRRILKGFSLDFMATDTAKLTGLSLRSVISIFIKMRGRIAQSCEAGSPYSNGIEPDKSYLASKQIHGKMTGNSKESAIVFGLFQKNGYIYTEMVPIAIKKTLIEVAKGRTDLDAVRHLDGWQAYDGLMYLGCKRHFRMLASGISLRWKHLRSTGSNRFGPM